MYKTHSLSYDFWGRLCFASTRFLPHAALLMPFLWYLKGNSLVDCVFLGARSISAHISIRCPKNLFCGKTDNRDNAFFLFFGLSYIPIPTTPFTLSSVFSSYCRCIVLVETASFVRDCSKKLTFIRFETAPLSKMTASVFYISSA